MYALNDLIENGSYIPPKESIFRLQEDKDGNIWAATPNSGIWKITPKNHKFVTKQYSINLGNAEAVGAMTLYIDSENTIWAGTNGKGLNVYNPHKDCFQNALPNAMKKGEVVSCILEDNQKGLWVTMTSEMIHIDKTKKETTYRHSPPKTDCKITYSTGTPVPKDKTANCISAGYTA